MKYEDWTRFNLLACIELELELELESFSNDIVRAQQPDDFRLKSALISLFHPRHGFFLFDSFHFYFYANFLCM